MENLFSERAGMTEPFHLVCLEESIRSAAQRAGISKLSKVPSIWDSAYSKGSATKIQKRAKPQGVSLSYPFRDYISIARLSSFYSTCLTLMLAAIPSGFIFPSLALPNIFSMAQEFHSSLRLSLYQNRFALGFQ